MGIEIKGVVVSWYVFHGLTEVRLNDVVKQDWFMKDRWAVPGSPASRAASARLGSVAPSMNGAPAIRKGQMVWTPDKGFMRESELKAC
jgi:hypothetical protein